MILLDFSLPGMSGFDVLNALKEGEKTKNIPVIAVTAKAMKNDRDDIMAAGCDEYVSKPIDREDLFSKIESLLQKLTYNS